LHSSSLRQLSHNRAEDEYLPKIYSIKTIKLGEDNPKIAEKLIKAGPLKSPPRYKKSESL
jgi:hypothetical protein